MTRGSPWPFASLKKRGVERWRAEERPMGRRLKPEELRAVCEAGSLPFASTADLPPLEGVIGQPNK